MFASLTNGPGFDPRQECLLTKEIGRILSQSTFGSPDENLSTASRGIMCMLYMYCERAVQNRQDVCAVHRRTASLQYDYVLYIEMVRAVHRRLGVFDSKTSSLLLTKRAFVV